VEEILTEVVVAGQSAQTQLPPSLIIFWATALAIALTFAHLVAVTACLICLAGFKAAIVTPSKTIIIPMTIKSSSKVKPLILFIFLFSTF
jgi:hypothetical protein